MSFYNKIGLLVLNDDQTKFLVCRKVPYSVTQQWIMPGGIIEHHLELDSLRAEIREDLSSDIDTDSLRYVGTYTDHAAGTENKEVTIKLYRGELLDKPRPAMEIAEIGWIGRDDINNDEVSPIIRDKIIPDLIKKEILK